MSFRLPLEGEGFEWPVQINIGFPLRAIPLTGELLYTREVLVIQTPDAHLKASP